MPRTAKTHSSVLLDEECTFVDLFHHQRNRALQRPDFRDSVDVFHKFKHVTHGRQKRPYLVVAILLILQSVEDATSTPSVPDRGTKG